METILSVSELKLLVLRSLPSSGTKISAAAL
jgi:hypothetical protein